MPLTFIEISRSPSHRLKMLRGAPNCLPPDESWLPANGRVLRPGFHRIMHNGLLTGSTRKESSAQVATYVAWPRSRKNRQPRDVTPAPSYPCCGGTMVIIDSFRNGANLEHRRPNTNKPEDRLSTGMN